MALDMEDDDRIDYGLTIRYQFSLRSLLLVTALLAVAFGLVRLAFSSNLPTVVGILALLSGLLL